MQPPVVGIDAAAFYTPRYFLDLRTLAEARGVDPNKYTVGLGQHKMAVCPPDEDIISMAANAAHEVVTDADRDQIDLLLFATESGVDQSKSAGVFVHRLLNLSPRCRIVELKQACYSATAGLRLAMPLLRENPNRKVLLIASDVARYGLNTTGESSQGGGAVALLLSANPRIVAVEPEGGFYTEDAMDFWRPNYREAALVEGKYSCELYLRLLKETWEQYCAQSGRAYVDHAHFCFHVPIPRLAEKAHLRLMQCAHVPGTIEDVKRLMAPKLAYSHITGNCYTASLYLSLLSLLDTPDIDCNGERVGFYSYGSGCVAEFFSGVVQPGYREHLCTAFHQRLLRERTELDQKQYESFYEFHFPTDGSRFIVPRHETGPYRLNRLEQHKRIYERASSEAAVLA